jgi:hypothetical protein
LGANAHEYRCPIGHPQGSGSRRAVHGTANAEDAAGAEKKLRSAATCGALLGSSL